MGLSDIYQVTHVYTDSVGHSCQNVYFYQQVGDGSGGTYASQSERLANDWRNDVLAVLLPTIPPTTTTNWVKVKSLFDPADQYDLPLAVVGTRGVVTEYLPTFVNVVVTLATSNGLIRKGRKAFNGFLEGDQSNGSLSALGIITAAIRAAACVIGVTALPLGLKAFLPVVVKRIPFIDPDGHRTYSLPGVIGEAIYGFVTSAVAGMILSTQNSRKD